MSLLPITWLEVFSDGPGRGTLHPVIHDAGAIDTEAMALVARRFRQPETSFVQPSEIADYRHRIFTAHAELPFAGHPSLGTAAAVAHRRGARRATYRQETHAGVHQLDVELPALVGEVAIHQGDPTVLGTPDVSPLLAALGLSRESLRSDLPCEIVSTGLETLIVPLRSTDDLERATPDPASIRSAIDAMPEADRLSCYFVVDTGNGRWRARMFAPDMPGGEDPATGSAVGPFGSWLSRHLGITHADIDQGVEIGADSRLTVDTTEGVVVSGGVRIVGSGSFEVPTR